MEVFPVGLPVTRTFRFASGPTGAPGKRAPIAFFNPSALNGSQFLDESAVFPQKAALEKDGAVDLGDRPGVGVEPDEDALRALALAQ